MLVFVYGTLMRGERNHPHLRQARFVGPAATTPGYTLYHVLAFDYPALVAEGETSVGGELYEVSDTTLEALDELEPSPYARAEVTLSDGRRVQSYLLPASALPEGALQIPGGCWRGRAPQSN